MKSMTFKEKSEVFFEVLGLIEEGGTPEALTYSPRLQDFSYAGIHVGDDKDSFTPEKTLEWLSGQILEIVEKQAWFAMNSLINVSRMHQGQWEKEGLL